MIQIVYRRMLLFIKYTNNSLIDTPEKKILASLLNHKNLNGNFETLRKKVKNIPKI